VGMVTRVEAMRAAILHCAKIHTGEQGCRFMTVPECCELMWLAQTGSVVTCAPKAPQLGTGSSSAAPHMRDCHSPSMSQIVTALVPLK
jgi:hypothetical protein